MATAAPTVVAACWERLPAEWRTERMLMAAGLVLAAIFLVAFCLVVSNVVRSAERQHEAFTTVAPAPAQVVSSIGNP